MKRVILSLICLISIGCHKADRLSGNPAAGSAASTTHELFLVACCTSNGVYPAQVPQDQIQLCQRAHQAVDNQIDGNTYLPIHNDCSNAHYIGNEYYNGTNL